MPTTSIRTATIPDLHDLVAFNQAMALESENKTLDEATLIEGEYIQTYGKNSIGENKMKNNIKRDP